MKLVGLLPCRNESWCLGLTARAALMWVDELIILDHASTDNSRDIAAEIERETKRVVVMVEENPTWDEMNHRQSMLALAREKLKATHIALIDADEILTGNLAARGPHPWVRGDWPVIAVYEAGGCDLVQLPGYNLRGGINQYHADGIWGNRWFASTFQDHPDLEWSGDLFHHREPRGRNLTPYRPIRQGQGGVMHLWGASERRLKAKHALYKITERLRWPQKPIAEIDKMYSWAIHGEPGHPSFGTPDTWTYSIVPPSWWAPYSHLMSHLDMWADPWQEAETRRLYYKHGPATFSGLDLFGVV